MLRTNVDKLVKNSVVGEITHPAVSSYRLTPDGRSRMLPGTGGITYNIRVGDIAVGWEADHVEPAVTIKNSDNNANSGLNTLSCVGNEAVVIGGDAKGEKGVVVGMHGGAEHVMIDVPFETMEKLLIGDKFMVKSFGIGLKLHKNHAPCTFRCRCMSVLHRFQDNISSGRLQIGIYPCTFCMPCISRGQQRLRSGSWPSHRISCTYPAGTCS